MDYAVIDVETSGGKFNQESIIEIAVYRFDGEKITDTFISLVNPEKKIDYFVQKLTGITPKMVRTAPKFYELAKRLIEITEDAIIVAHNADFDYRVIRTEYQRLGFDYQRATLDTLALSKELLPELPSYSLGKLCTSLGIPLSDRHRAYGDARATVKLLQLLLAKDTQKNIVQSSVKQVHYKSFNTKIIRLIENLPSDTGVFYLHDAKGKIIYLNKATSINHKAQQILTGKQAGNLQKKTENISYELTGNEIIALIKAKNEIKINQPQFRPEKEQTVSGYGIFKDTTKKEFTLKADPISKENKNNTILSFSTPEKAQAYIEEFKNKAKENKDSPLKKLISDMYLRKGKYLLTGNGRSRGESSFLLMENGVLKGYGFYTLHSQIKNIDRIKKIMTPAAGSAEIYLKIRNKLSAERFQKIIPIDK